MRIPTFALGIAMMVALTARADITGGKKKLQPTQRFVGVLKNADDWGRIGNKRPPKRSDAPECGYLTNQDALNKLWEAWSLNGKAPKLDFAKEIVFVQTMRGASNIRTTYSLDKKGDLTVEFDVTPMPGIGLAYSIDVLKREGIKTYRGESIN